MATRGRLVLVTQVDNIDKVFTSPEFNGDMYWSGFGKRAYNTLDKVKTFDDYEKRVKKFNSNYFGYNGPMVVSESMDNLKDLSSYIKKWGSDYLYIKNITGHDIDILDESGNPHILKSDKVSIVYFGKVSSKEEEAGEDDEYDD